jgi:glycosyltransferase involved in cell wall biosynthesis
MWSRSVGNGLMASSAKVIAISKCIAAMYREEVPSSRLVTIYDGVDDGRFRRSGHKIMQQKPYTLVFLGNFNRHKGQIEFSMACAKVFCEGVHDFRVWFIGAGDAEVRHECEEIFARAEMKDRVTYLGFQKNPEDFLEKADVAFTCSQFEGWGRVTAEAMMAGCLAVGADTGATPELISDGITGMLFHYEPGRCDSLATIIKMALANPEQSRYLAEAGRQFAVTKMTSTLNAGEIFFLYKAIISARH